MNPPKHFYFRVKTVNRGNVLELDVEDASDVDVAEVVRCKDCKYFERDYVEDVNGFPLITAHEICTRWSNGVKTNEDGYCFLAERRDAE